MYLCLMTVPKRSDPLKEGYNHREAGPSNGAFGICLCPLDSPDPSQGQAQGRLERSHSSNVLQIEVHLYGTGRIIVDCEVLSRLVVCLRFRYQAWVQSHTTLGV